MIEIFARWNIAKRKSRADQIRRAGSRLDKRRDALQKNVAQAALEQLRRERSGADVAQLLERNIAHRNIGCVHEQVLIEWRNRRLATALKAAKESLSQRESVSTLKKVPVPFASVCLGITRRNGRKQAGTEGGAKTASIDHEARAMRASCTARSSSQEAKRMNGSV